MLTDIFMCAAIVDREKRGFRVPAERANTSFLSSKSLFSLTCMGMDFFGKLKPDWLLVAVRVIPSHSHTVSKLAWLASVLAVNESTIIWPEASCSQKELLASD